MPGARHFAGVLHPRLILVSHHNHSCWIEVAAIPFRIEALTTAKGGYSVQSESSQSLSSWLSFRDEHKGSPIFKVLLCLS